MTCIPEKIIQATVENSGAVKPTVERHKASLSKASQVISEHQDKHSYWLFPAGCLKA